MKRLARTGIWKWNLSPPAGAASAAVRGFLCFHTILRRDGKKRFGQSVVVWIVQLSHEIRMASEGSISEPPHAAKQKRTGPGQLDGKSSETSSALTACLFPTSNMTAPRIEHIYKENYCLLNNYYWILIFILQLKNGTRGIFYCFL